MLICLIILHSLGKERIRLLTMIHTARHDLNIRLSRADSRVIGHFSALSLITRSRFHIAINLNGSSFVPTIAIDANGHGHSACLLFRFGLGHH